MEVENVDAIRGPKQTRLYRHSPIVQGIYLPLVGRQAQGWAEDVRVRLPWCHPRLLTTEVKARMLKVARAALPPLSLPLKLGDFQQIYRADFGRGRVQQAMNQCRFVVSYYEQMFRHSHSHSCRCQGAMTVLDVCLTLLFSIFLILYAAVGSNACLTDRQRRDRCLRG